ncbi:hypothetical protein DMB65_09450 [Flavobacterium cheongpyeongense]|jgi:hypothetical protein|uniref:Outer membrane lipoprotein-sorting protein n=1 Tax=Flavobacterium cheongpyeongense TaxID=2212651 RepID=A0A2V4BQ93_9FLAO|nr:hypothetical protein [Flavobacterium cheongpyeongense]PXY41169.1 hypothetical protein DMB65_09450 [Flavobacterium cheongpyeongense]
MLYKSLFIISFLSASVFGHAQTVNEVLQRMGKQYSSAESLQYNSNYTLYKTAESKKPEQAYKGFFRKNPQNEIYMKIDQTEILNSKSINLKISHSEKAILISDPLQSYFGNFDINPLLDLCKIESFKDFKIYWEIILIPKKYSNLPYSKIVVQISKKYFLQKSVFYYNTAVNFSKDYRSPKSYMPRLEVTNLNFNRKAVNASLFADKTYFDFLSKNKYVTATRLKNYEIIDQRNISNK